MTGKAGDAVFIEEGDARIFRTSTAHVGNGPGEKGKEAFYNSAMRLNRDISVMVIRSLPDGIRVLDAMGATGIRGIRYALEGGRKEVHISEIREEAAAEIRSNAELNGADITVHNRDANTLMREMKFDFIDIDPFGTPVPFIDSALAGLKDRGILAITATDTAPLCGTYPAVCRRRYLAEPVHSHFGHESGLRILLGFVARMGGMHDMALTPVLSYYRDHYFRAFFRAKKGAGRANRNLESLKYFTFDEKSAEWNIYDSAEDAGRRGDKVYGPIWGGPPGDTAFIESVLDRGENMTEDSVELVRMLSAENDAPIFFHDVDVISSVVHRSPPPREAVFRAVPDAVRTHFSPLGFKTSLSAREVIDLFREL